MRTLVPALLSLVLLAACDGSRDRLLAHLQSTRPEERAVAVRKLADQGRSEDLVLFTRAAKDPAPVVRAEAAIALGKSLDPRVVDLLGELLGDPDESVQGKAAMALAQVKSEKAKAYLTMQYSRRGRSTRQAIVDALKAANVPGAMAQVVAAESSSLWERNLRALNEGSLPERVAAAEELGKSGRVEAVNRLLPLIKDSQVILAAAAVRGLGYAGDARAVGPIAELLTENFPELRESATEALVRLKDPKALPRLKEIALEKSAASAQATQAIVALPVLPESNAALCELALKAAPDDAVAAGRAMRSRGGCPLDPVVEGLGRRAEQLSALRALEALGQGAKTAAARVLPFLSSRDEALRLQAVRTAGELGDASAIEGVRKLYDQELKRTQALRADWIATALPLRFQPGYDPAGEELAAPPGPVLDQKLKQEDLFKRIRAANDAKLRAAGKSEVVRVVPPAEVVDDATDDQLRPLAAAIRALGQLGAPGALQRLKAHVDDPSPGIRIAAFQGLATLGPEGIAVARQGLLDGVREVQGAVASALAEQGAAGQAAIADVLPKLAADHLPLLLALDKEGPDKVTTPALLRILDEGGAESAIAAQLLGRIGTKEAVGPLTKVFDDPTSVARREAMVALGQIGDARAADSIVRELNDENPDLRAAAAEALRLLGKPAKGADALDALKGDYYRRVRESAEAALAKSGTGAPEAKRQE